MIEVTAETIKEIAIIVTPVEDEGENGKNVTGHGKKIKKEDLVNRTIVLKIIRHIRETRREKRGDKGMQGDRR